MQRSKSFATVFTVLMPVYWRQILSILIKNFLFLIQYSIKNVKETVTLLQAYESGFFVEKISQN